MVAEIIWDAAIGQLIRLFTRNRYLQHPEEKPNFQISAFYDTTTPPTPQSPVIDLEKQDVLSPGPTPGESTISGFDLSVNVSKEELGVPTGQDLAQIASKPVVPEKLDDGTILVTWYTEDDQSNPQNWSLTKKSVTTAIIMLYTSAVYLGGSIYAPAAGGVMEAFGVSTPVASLGLALYVVGYGKLSLSARYFHAQEATC